MGNPDWKDDIEDIEDILKEGVGSGSESTLITAIVAQKTASFNNGATANAVAFVNDISIPEVLKRVYTLALTNPSTESDITVQLFLKESIGGNDKWCEYGDPITIAKGNNAYTGATNGKVLLVHGAMFAKGLGIGVKIGSTITTGFNVGITVREGD